MMIIDMALGMKMNKKGAVDIILSILAVILIGVIGMAVIHSSLVHIKSKKTEEVKADIVRDDSMSEMVKFLYTPNKEYDNNFGLIMADYYDYLNGNKDSFDNIDSTIFGDNYRLTIFHMDKILYEREEGIDDSDSLIEACKVNLTNGISIMLERIYDD